MPTPLTAFLPYVLPQVPACTDPLAEQAIRSACIEFCTESLLIQELVTTSMLAGVQDYEVEVPTNAMLVKLLGMLIADQWIEPTTVESVRSGAALRGTVGATEPRYGTPEVYFQKTPTASEFSFYPIPSETVPEGVTVRAAFAPSRTASLVPDALFTDWVEEIAAGALTRLYAMSSQPFYDKGASMDCRARFELGIRKAAIQARTGLVSSASQVQPVRFV